MIPPSWSGMFFTPIFLRLCHISNNDRQYRMNVYKALPGSPNKPKNIALGKWFFRAAATTRSPMLFQTFCWCKTDDSSTISSMVPDRFI